jgi:L-histidine N-alpha-methyltransferase
MNICLPGAGLDVSFHEGEEILTEISAKFRPAGITAELEVAGFEVSGQWTDSEDRFAMTLAKAM